MDLHRELADGRWSAASGDGLSGRSVVGGSWRTARIEARISPTGIGHSRRCLEPESNRDCRLCCLDEQREVGVGAG